jgi:hypothetical protein
MTLSGGSVIEMKIGRLPKRTAERPHGLKYSLYYGQSGRRIVGYDNETKSIIDTTSPTRKRTRSYEEPYPFVDVETLVADSLASVRHARGES